MECRDPLRRAGGQVWVVAGALLIAAGSIAGAPPPGVVTWVLGGAIVALALVTAIAPSGRPAVVAGWVTASLLAADLAGAVLDRFGVFGPPGSPGVSWGDWAAFENETAVLLHHPAAVVTTAAAVAATAAEVALAVLLALGWQRRRVGDATAALFVVYTVALAASTARADVLTYAMPILVGGALLVAATPTRTPRDDRASTVDSAARELGHA